MKVWTSRLISMTTVKGYQGRRLICDFQLDGRSFKETGKVQFREFLRNLRESSTSIVNFFLPILGGDPGLIIS